MAYSNFGDNSTVVGDPSYKLQDDTLTKEPSPHKPSTSRTGVTSKGRKHNEFTSSTDYTLEERPFFVPITKDGVIVALNKLNKQLVEVCLIFVNLHRILYSLFLGWHIITFIEEEPHDLDRRGGRSRSTWPHQPWVRLICTLSYN